MHLTKEEYAVEQEIANNTAHGQPITPEAKIYRDNSIYERKLKSYGITHTRSVLYKKRMAPPNHVFFVVTGRNQKVEITEWVMANTKIVTADMEPELIADLKKVVVDRIDQQFLINRAKAFDANDRKKARNR